ncbi:hypothetical protein BBO99_00003838 [Phytophthora kernoviae]|uniref:Regulator of chromosome condensation 1/beta-lactamase-inhibitor protein II n=2 Tax=Phytophthora kernoviae TaxID=325452 RepID=A0A3R7J8K3_9STRA|nr:hypothetical protein G195_004231 [Phytophthora kernoviae 00238/432]KAG2528847.1 hypothetical protein JM18_003154 [Phytophthora kernoviae]RLN10044.1 hypothetical protein BBI17_003889 [Phytophthora kernoviae]RLN81273.1 hypothetical protein BBO99_00003838 [Phytophthora kernoviae]
MATRNDNRIFQSGRVFMKQDGCAMWRPIEIKLESSELPSSSPKFVAVEAGHLAAYALDDQGHLYSWGTQIFGQLGHGEVLEEDSFCSKDPSGGGIETNADDEGSDEANFAEDKQEQVLEVEEEGEEKDEENGEPPPKIVIVEKMPKLVEGLAGHPIVKISAGNHFVVAISTSGAVFSWGRGCFGQLGNGGVADVSTPARVEALANYIAIDIGAGAIKVAAGADHSLVLCGVGVLTFLYAFGDNRLGQLGIASHADHVDMPSFVDEFVNVHIAAIGAGTQYSAALTGDGEMFTWGDARYGKSCRADGRTTYVPWKIDLPNIIPSSSFITQLSVGMHHTLAQLRISTLNILQGGL